MAVKVLFCGNPFLRKYYDSLFYLGCLQNTRSCNGVIDQIFNRAEVWKLKYDLDMQLYVVKK